MNLAFTRASEYVINWYLSDASPNTTYWIQAQSNSTYRWIGKTSGTTSSSGYASGDFTVDSNVAYNCRGYYLDATESPVYFDTQSVPAYVEPTYTISTGVFSGSGSATGGGSFSYGDTCTLTATADNGYQFDSWTDEKGSVTYSSSNPYTFTVTSSDSIFAVFTSAPATYTITTSVNPEGSGYVTAGGSYTEGTQIDLYATAETAYGYEFGTWYKDGELYSTNDTIHPYVTADAAYVANFNLTSYTVSYLKGLADTGTVPSSQTKYYDVNLTLRTNTGSLARNDTSTTTDYTTTFDSNGGTTTKSSSGSAKTVTTSYTFDGWATSASGAKAYDAGGTYITNGAIDFYPYFSWQSSSSYGTVYFPTSEECYRTGYTLLGFDENQSATTATYDPGEAIQPTSSKTYYAIWEQIPYTLTVTSSDTSKGTVTGGGTYPSGQIATLTATATSGNKFRYWTKGGVQQSDENPWELSVTETASYIGQFTSLNTYTISYSSEGSTSGTAPSSQTKTEDADLTLRTNTGSLTKVSSIAGPERAYYFNTEGGTSTKISQTSTSTVVDSYICDGWSGTSGGTKTYDLGGTYTANSDMTLYPHFDHDTTTTSWISITTPTTTECTKEGHTLKGWTTTEGGEVEYTPGQVITPTGTSTVTVQLYAVWEINTFTVTLTPLSGGTISGESTATVAYGTSYSTSNNVLTIGSLTFTATANAGFEFTGWSFNPASSDNKITTNTTVMAGFTKTYTYAVGYLANGGTGAPDTQLYGPTQSTSHTFTIPTTTPTYTGHVFSNWLLQGTTTTYNPGGTITVDYQSTTKTLVAQWNLETYTVYYQPGSYAKESSTYTQTKSYGVDITLRGSTYTRDNYVQDGWSTTDGGAKVYDLSGTYSTNAQVVLYPHWEEDTKYTITVQAGTGGQVTTGASGNYYAGTNLELACSVNTGYKFVNWTENGVECASTQAVSDYYTPAYNATIQCNFVATQYWNWTNTIAAGQPITNLTATDWNNFTAAITTQRARLGYDTWTFTTATQGNPFTAAMFNQAVEALAWRDTAKTTSILSITGLNEALVNSPVTTGDRVLASYFEGSGSLKYALNNLMDN